MRPHLAALLLLLASCSSAPAATATPSPSSSPPPPPADGGTHASPAELIAALERAGLPCYGARPPVGDPGPGRDLVSCTPDDGESVTVVIYSDEAVLAKERIAFAEAGRIIGKRSMVTGLNWTLITKSDAYAAKAQKVIGGDLRLN